MQPLAYHVFSHFGWVEMQGDTAASSALPPGRWGAQGDTDQRGIDQRLRASQLINVAEADIQNLLTA